MAAAAIAENEAERLAALVATGLLDSEHEAVFDAIVTLAATICGVPIAAISLIDRDRQWFKASVGLDVSETPREDAFCAHTILRPEAMEIGDACADERFRDNRLVLGEPLIRFYAGVPLRTGEGLALGALCVIDREPRQLDEAQRRSLQQLAQVVERLFAARVQALRQQQFIVRITDAMPALILYLDHEERVRFANAELGRRAGGEAARVLGWTFRKVCGPGLYARIESQLRRAQAGEDVDFEGSERLGGRLVHYHNHYLPDRDDQGRVRGVFALSFDVSEQREAELAARRAERRLQLIADNLPGAISIIDRDHVYRFNSAEYERALGKPLAMITDHSVREVHGDAVYAQVRPHLERALAGERSNFELVLPSAGGARFLRGTYVPKRDDDGSVVGVFGLILDQTELKQAEDRLRQMAEHDALTGLINRYRLYEEIAASAARARRHGGARALLYLDIDKFKAINDRHGHAGGDAVLVEFSRRLKTAVRATDTVARLAGDEFVILLEDVAAIANATHVAETVVAAMQPPVSWNGFEIAVGTSIGIAFCEDAGEEADAWLHRADEALYAAKAAGRDTWRVADG
ncbi:MAG: diguanylate cyclase [Xanthomonadales bacterium]|nr:diguanylate cyclase [Xanthomonadales bacterium]